MHLTNIWTSALLISRFNHLSNQEIDRLSGPIYEIVTVSVPNATQGLKTSFNSEISNSYNADLLYL